MGEEGSDVIKAGIHCLVTMTKGRGSIVTGEFGPFHNLITNNGLDLIADTIFEDLTTYCHCGTGDAEVLPGDTSLDSFVAATNNIVFDSLSTQGLPPYYTQYIQTYRFAAGTFNNESIKEVAFTDQATGGNLFSRALVKTPFGVLTSSAIRSDEWLDVTYQFRVYPQYINADGSVADGTGTVTTPDGTHDYVIRPANVTNVAYWDASKAKAEPFAVSTAYMSGYQDVSVLQNSTLQPTLPGGTDLSTDADTGSVAALTYTNGTFNRDLTYNASPAALNASVGGLGCVRFHTGFGAYQMSFDPPIPKWWNQFQLKVNVAWGNQV